MLVTQRLVSTAVAFVLVASFAEAQSAGTISGTVQDASGAAHVLLKAPPKEPVTLVLDTSGDKQLRPKNPELNLEMPFDDKLVLFDRSFTREAPVVRRSSKPAGSLGPTPITTPR